MKNLLVLALMLVSSMSFADTSAVERILYDGFSVEEEVNLSTEKTRTEFRTVRVPATCYRTEYRTRCHQEPPRCQRVCDRNGNCRNRCAPGRRVCRQVPVRVPYSCTRTERRAYQVHDYFVETNVRFNFDNTNIQDIVDEEFVVSVNGEQARLTATGSKNYFLVLDRSKRTESMGNGVKNVFVTYNVRLVPASLARTVLENGIQNVKLRNGILTYNLGEGFNLRSFNQQIRIFENRRLGSDPLLLDKNLSSRDMNIQTNARTSAVSIDLTNLGIQLPNNMRVILDTKFDIDESKVLNAGEIKTSASANWIFR